MRPLEAPVLGVDLLAWCALIVPLRTSRRWIRNAVVAVPAVAIVQAYAEGPRWQLAPAYVLCAVVVLVWRFNYARSPLKFVVGALRLLVAFRTTGAIRPIGAS